MGVAAVWGIPALMVSLVEKRCISPAKTEEIEVWRHELIAIRPKNETTGKLSGRFLLGGGDVDGRISSSTEYQYLYDTGDGIEWDAVPVETTKIYPVLGESDAPYIAYWRKDAFYESLLTESPTRLPLGTYGCRGVESRYTIYVPEGSIPTLFELS